MDLGLTDHIAHARISAGWRRALLILFVAVLGAVPLLISELRQAAAESRTSNVWMQRYGAAMQFYNAGEYGRSLAAFRNLADHGSAGAQTMLGHHYATGKGVVTSPGKAAVWYHRAADRGYPPAQLALGRAYLRGQGVPHDLVQAAVWLELAADRGSPEVRAAATGLRRSFDTRLTPAQRRTATRQRQSWRPDIALVP